VFGTPPSFSPQFAGRLSASSAAALAALERAAGRGHLQRRAGGAERGQMALGTGAAAADGNGPGQDLFLMLGDDDSWISNDVIG